MLIYLLRHGQTSTNVHFIPGIIRPKTEPLTEHGLEQAIKAAEFIAGQLSQPSLIVSSPYTRAVQTATAIKEQLGIPLEESEGLGEYIIGDWDGMHIDEIKLLFGKIPLKEQYTFKPPGGESWLDEARRFNAVIESIKNQGHSTVVLVSHYDPIKAIINMLTKCPANNWGDAADYPPGSVTTISEHNGIWKVTSKKVV